jgi:hypothetical protein
MPAHCALLCTMHVLCRMPDHNNWQLRVTQPKSWRPAWELPLQIVVPFVAVIVGLMYMYVLVSKERYARLVQSVLPPVS